VAPRVPKITEAEMSAEQRRIAEIIGGARGGIVDGPFALWLRVPEIAERAQHFSDRIRSKSTFEKRLFEVMVMAATRPWSATYAFEAHARTAESLGVAPAVVDAIRQRRTPLFDREDERLVYDTVTELMQSRKLSDASYGRALEAFGREGLIELITAAGFYNMIAMMLAAFDVPPPAGIQPLS
jgi:4-carboxymuconolactone decarboxylase